MADPIPSKIGKYSIAGTLGRGAMGVVYKGFDPHIKRPVAIKTIRRELMNAEQAALLTARFAHEAQAAGRLSHPGVVAVYEYGEQDTLAYIVMELVEGSGLNTYFERGVVFPLSDALGLMSQLLEALHFAHEHGVVHRDIKPANLMITAQGKLKVADFGIARIDTSELTGAGMSMGTPSHMAPEQYASKAPVDRRADVFSAGVVLYRLLTNLRPFDGADAQAVAYQTCNVEPLPPSLAAPGRDLQRFDAVALKALAKNPEARFQTARAFLEALQALQALQAEPDTERSSTTPWLTDSAAEESFESRCDSAALAQVEQQLTRFVGPVARVLVKQAASKATDMASLHGILAEGLATDGERAEFLSSVAQAQVMLPPHAVDALAPEVISRGARALAVHLGPIAKILARKLAAQTNDEQRFFALLAAELSNPKERERFLADVGAR